MVGIRESGRVVPWSTWSSPQTEHVEATDDDPSPGAGSRCRTRNPFLGSGTPYPQPAVTQGLVAARGELAPGPNLRGWREEARSRREPRPPPPRPSLRRPINVPSAERVVDGVPQRVGLRQGRQQLNVPRFGWSTIFGRRYKREGHSAARCPTFPSRPRTEGRLVFGASTRARERYCCRTPRLSRRPKTIDEFSSFRLFWLSVQGTFGPCVPALLSLTVSRGARVHHGVSEKFGARGHPFFREDPNLPPPTP